MTSNRDWEGRVGHAWAAEWLRTDRSFGELTQTLLARIAPLAGARILDIGCGAGELSLAFAQARPDAQVTGLDLSPELLDAASARGGDRANLSFVQADASEWRPDEAPDLLVSRHGVMFFDDPRTAFAHIAGFAAPGANLVFSCFRAPAHNRWAGEVAQAVAPDATQGSPDGYAPGPFGFADPALVEDILTSAGWRDVSLTPVDYAYVAGVGKGEAAVEDALSLLRRIGPAARALRELPEAERTAAESRLRTVLEARREGSQIAWPAAAWIVSARKG
ncbi:class I SAM-dependent methyltransferase [Novosphingobium sp. ZN18A2]|uniref:class I SAM-dependent methyltransferase n=1 Tax=Novosphingobium sp. ZN18A2 TaxID=3079861 RepID=UPI0030CDF615